MSNFSPEQIKNIVLLGHAGTGKTTLAETMSFESGIISRRGKVEEKNTVSDYHEIEQEKGNSLFSTLLHCEWRNTKINVIDTPGSDDFVGEVIASMRVADTGLMLVNATQGVEVGTELIWEYADRFKKPTIFVVNQIDQEKSDFEKSIDQIKERFGSKAIVVQYPLNQGDGFNTIVDVLKMTCYKFPEDGGKPEKIAIPDSEKAKADELHNSLVEAAAENDDALMELYFEKGELNEDQMRKGLKLGLINRQVFPIFCLSAAKNMGSGRLMGFLQNVAPSAADMPAETLVGGESLACDPSGATSLFVYKTISEPHLGEMSFFKVTSGTIKEADDLVNTTSGGNDRISQLFIVDGKKRTKVSSMGAGDLGATVKLKSTSSNTTLSPKGAGLEIEPIVYPTPRIRAAVMAQKSGEEEKLSMALSQISGEDPTLLYEHSKELKQLIVQGQGALHLQILKWKLENLYKVDIDYLRPKIPYRETIQKSVKADYRHKKQSGGSGQFGEVHMLVEPYTEGMPPPKDYSLKNVQEVELEWGGKLIFNWCIVGGAIDNKYQNAILKGIMERMTEGPLTGSYARDIRVSIFDGKMHAVDSNDMAFKLASRAAFKDAFVKADPKILEPIYRLEVMVTGDLMGDVMTDLNSRRATIEGMEAEGHYQKIIAKVPLVELYQYSSTLRSLTQGRAKFTRSFADYTAAPYEVQQKLVKEHSSEQVEA